jgi:RNA polymerase sigma-70 factor (ECF subfamily)
MAYSNMDKEVSQLASRESEAFRELYQQHVESVYRYHLARTGSVQDAEDLTAQTFLSALENLHTYQKRSTLVTWLFGIASHKLADFYRHRKENLPFDAVSPLAEDYLDLEEITDHDLRINTVALAMQSLIPERREALILRIFAGLSAWEVGLVMGKSEAAVKMLVHRGLKDLQKLLFPGSKSE